MYIVHFKMSLNGQLAASWVPSIYFNSYNQAENFLLNGAKEERFIRDTDLSWHGEYVCFNDGTTTRATIKQIYENVEN